MPKVPIFRLRTSDSLNCPDLRRYQPALGFSDLQLGVDNLRYDVFLGARLTADLSFHLGRYICRFGEVESLFGLEIPTVAQTKVIRPEAATRLKKPGPVETYPPGSWGPKAAQSLVHGIGRWHEPWV